MICFRCGTEVEDSAPQCPNCGQRFAGGRKTFTATTTSFRALEKRRARAQKAAEALPYSIGDVIGARYEVRDLVGRGPLGAVYRVHDQEIEVDVALKVIHKSLLADDGARRSFSETIRRVRKLSHQNIVRIYDEAADGDLRFFTMQLLEGLTLKKVMSLRHDKGERFTPREAEPILSHIALALGHAHRHAVHGDLKPENVLLLPDVLKLTDFSAHEAIPSGSFARAQKTAERDRYLAPEVLDGGAVDPRADIYSLGVLLYELVCGQPFAPDAPPVSEVTDQPDEAVPSGLDSVVARATDSDPAKRFDTAEAFSEALGVAIDARELPSVDLSMAGAVLLPEDLTQKFKAPPELQDDPDEIAADIDGVDAPTTERPVVGGAAATPPPFDESEGSFVELLDDDLAIVEDAESIDVPGGIPLEIPQISGAPAAPPRDLDAPPEISFGGGPPPEQESERSATMVPAAPPAQGPWFLRSNIGFLAMVALIIGVGAWAVFALTGDSGQSRRVVQLERMDAAVARVPTGAPKAPATPPAVAATPDAAVVAAIPDAAPVAAARADAGQVAVAMAQPTVESEPEKPAELAPPVPAAPSDPVETPPRPAAPVVPPSAGESPKVPEPKPQPKPQPEPEPKPEAEPAPAAPPPPPKPVAASDGDDTVLSCPSGMKLVTLRGFPKGGAKRGKIKGAAAVAAAKDGKAFCVDAYEYPGRRGARPKVSVNLKEARGLCEAAGKKLCSGRQWRAACGGTYPYGRSFNPARCVTEDDDGDERSLSKAGSMRRCRSRFGAYDMSGNAAEWTDDGYVRGGDYAAYDEDAACGGAERRSPGSRRPGIGFRCCAAPR